ncbi:uncharacterized protein HMPREF1541_02026 [Cyphellophora europaea CBS 101466]|uniref:Cupin type-1 domain-containing protein n=1 Tax=Cyphellophora europaea (strain CBS 101466) TaxID=1220924 RepID=W2S4A7_CYPE1|nr:uncharacterized protein HMPREF1541_02026 [Cyphellophora europaea CBS 101466]ETN42868.1 hypothetical protein HMPREF1541_02026 [Cyphellophora europaea CBS 101466]
MLATVALALAATLLTGAALGERPKDPELSRNLRSALTQVDFWNELSDADWVFDFSKVMADPYHPGSVLNANAATFPIITGSGMTVAQLNLGPCAMLAPHSHPRATNLVVSVSGSTKTFMRAENGADDRVTTLTPGKMTVFPQGSMHAMVNQGCSDNLLYSFLNHEDSGTLNFAQSLWATGEDMMGRIMPMCKDEKNDWNETGRAIPDWGTGSQDGLAACRLACGMFGKGGR